jgi:hypothetical protein
MNESSKYKDVPYFTEVRYLCKCRMLVLLVVKT